MNNAIIKSAGNAMSKMGFQLRKHSPEILVIAGVAGTVASAVMACRATLKVNDILEETKDQVDVIHESADTGKTPDGRDYSQEDSKKDLTIVYAQTGVKFVKLYGPSIALGALSITGILASNNILRKRNVALAAAYATIDRGFKDYRSRVVERFGESVDRELKYNLKAQKVTETVVDEETGKEKKVKKTVLVPGEGGIDQNGFARFFDVGCNGWEPDASLNKAFLIGTQSYFNTVLQTQGYLFLDDVYKYLGFRVTEASRDLGWVYEKDNPVGDNYVDFRFDRDERFMEGYEKSVMLDFNIDGPITTRFERADRTMALC